VSARSQVDEGRKFFDAAAVLGVSESGEEAQLIGLEWVRAQVDSHD
jgi:hypothetical protein